MQPEQHHDPGKTVRIPLLAIGLIGLATLLYEILLTRIFSLTMWYHFAFVAISLALLGIGAGGVWVSVARGFFDRSRATSRMAAAAIAFGVAVPVVFTIDLQIPFVPFDAVPPGEVAALVQAYLLFTTKFVLLGAPFFFSGLILAIAFTHGGDRVHRIYFADLVGGSLGCFLVVPVLMGLSGPSAILLVAVFPFLAATLFCLGLDRQRYAYVGLIGVFATLLAVGVNEASPWLQVERIKSYEDNTGQVAERPIIFERWHPVSRVAVHPLEQSGNPLAWFYAEPFPQFPPVLEVTNDGGARTYIYPEMSPEQARQLFSRDVSDVAYALTDEPKVLIVGVGGGKDVLSAMALGAGQIRAVELNPVMIQVVQEVFSEFSGHPYDDPRVEVVIDEGRNHVESHDERYDLIKISVTDTWAASVGGAYALTESYLYTEEAFAAFMEHLRPGGFLSITRWYPFETLRITALASEGLRAAGYQDVAQRTLLARNGSAVNLIVKNGVITEAEAAAFATHVEAANLVLIHSPGAGASLSQHETDRLHREVVVDPSLESIEWVAEISLKPTTDDRPFFFHFMKLADAHTGDYKKLSSFELQHGRALTLLLGLFWVALIVAVVFVLSPFLINLGSSEQARSAPLTARLSANLYFLALGLGYLLAEIPLLQSFILFLGHPIYSLVVVLFAMLLFSGLGSLLAGRLVASGRFPPLYAPVLCVVVLVAMRFFLPELLDHAIGLPISGRIVLTVAAIAPVGLCLGMPFPVGLAIVGRNSATPVAWAWAVNGAASVAAPVVAMIVAIQSGFSTAYLLGAACYAAASLMLLGFTSSAK